jgi:hypothetical protein
VRAAFRYLAEAWQFAEELARNPWDFAVEVQSLREMGLNNNDFRWMVCKNLAEHAREVTAVGDSCRVFRPDRPLSFVESTCFVLTAEGLAFARVLPEHERAAWEPAEPRVGPIPDGPKKPVLPRWCPDRQELRVGDVVVKQFKVPAENQERILAAFEEEGWPLHIHDPLPPRTDQDSKRRLHNTINSLNRHHKHPLIRFSGNGNGQGIRWEWIPSAGVSEGAGPRQG